MGRTGPAGDFKRFQDARTAEIFNELLSAPLARGSGAGRVREGQLKAESLEYIEAAFGGETEFDVPINPYSVVFEFVRQLVQLRETNSITETTFAQFARQVLAWVNRALKSPRIVANSLDSEGGVFDGTAFQSMVLEMEKQMRALNERNESNAGG